MDDRGYEHGVDDIEELPGWLADIDAGLCIHTHFLISGNTHDLYVLSGESQQIFVDRTEALWRVLRDRQYAGMLLFDVVRGARAYRGSDIPDEIAEAVPAVGVTDPEAVIALLEAMFQSDTRTALVIDYATQFLDGLRQTPDLFNRFLVSIHKLSHPRAGDERPPCTVFWILDQPGDLPDWFAIANAAVTAIRVGLPDQEQRLQFAQNLVAEGLLIGGEEPGLGDRSELFALHAEGMSLTEMRQVAILAQWEDIPSDDIRAAIKAYRIGTPRNPWRTRLMQTRIGIGRRLLTGRVKGQDPAIDKTLDILVRSFMGLSGIQTSSAQTRPRGVLFFAGPTGVGKTELAKSVTELLFGDETAYHRFDMSEFLTEHSETRLIGAPPGSTGHEAGGALVNAVRARPFGVFLFDEIDKAHPRVLDLFLQIIDEGRLTDARGETAYFSEALLIFTSNIGIVGDDRSTNMGLRVLPSDTHDRLEAKIVKGVQDHFRFELKRPELMNRLGQNIVVFDFIHPQSARAIFDVIIRRVIDAVLQEHRIEVTLSNAARDMLEQICTTDLFDGGRGIGNRIESGFVNPLAHLIFDRAPGDRILITEVVQTGSNVKLVAA